MVLTSKRRTPWISAVLVHALLLLPLSYNGGLAGVFFIFAVAFDLVVAAIIFAPLLFERSWRKTLGFAATVWIVTVAFYWFKDVIGYKDPVGLGFGISMSFSFLFWLTTILTYYTREFVFPRRWWQGIVLGTSVPILLACIAMTGIGILFTIPLNAIPALTIVVLLIQKWARRNGDRNKSSAVVSRPGKTLVDVTRAETYEDTLKNKM